MTAARFAAWVAVAFSSLPATGARATESLAAPGAAVAATVPVMSAPASWVLGFESVRLPGGEAMGLLGTSYVVELAPGWWLGPALYGAASGQRGGLFTWGAEAQRRWRLGQSWQAAVGLYVGGGGGAGAPDGGGLMLRPHAEVLYDFGAWAAGLGISELRFPSGAIRSSQFGLVLRLRDDFAYTLPGPAGRQAAFAGVGGLGLDRAEGSLGRYRMRGATAASVGYVGMRLERQLGDTLSATLDGHGAATGGADGYAEFSAGLLAQWPGPQAPARIGVRAALGLGGGGAVATGGGALVRASLAGRLQLKPGVSVGLEAGRARALSGDFDARFTQVSLGMALHQPTGAGVPRTVQNMDWALSLQHYTRAQRKSGAAPSLDAVGLKFGRALGDHLYLTAQAHSAIVGGAGAFSVGLIGLGVSTPLAGRTRVGVELAVGAAGGGGIASRGGAVLQPMAWLGRSLGPHSQLRLGAGTIRSLRGELAAPVLDLTWAVSFAVP